MNIHTLFRFIFSLCHHTVGHLSTLVSKRSSPSPMRFGIIVFYFPYCLVISRTNLLGSSAFWEDLFTQDKRSAFCPFMPLMMARRWAGTLSLLIIYT